MGFPLCQTFLVLIGLSFGLYSHPLLQLVGCPMQSLVFLHHCQMTSFHCIHLALWHVWSAAWLCPYWLSFVTASHHTIHFHQLAAQYSLESYAQPFSASDSTCSTLFILTYLCHMTPPCHWLPPVSLPTWSLIFFHCHQIIMYHSMCPALLYV